MITILTPTYNRDFTLTNLYKSLLEQTDKRFEWLIVDDGSIDTTKSLVDKFKEEEKMDIKYFYQENGGKHRALNLGIEKAAGELTFIVDSDDVLTENAIEEIYNTWKDVSEKNLCGISFLRGFTPEKCIGDEHSSNYVIDDFINMRFNKGIGGDKAEVWVTQKLREIPFPEIEGEKFFGESYVWINLAKNYKMLFVNKIIYITEYLEGGLTKSGRKLRIQCPIGGMINAEQALGKEFNIKDRIKNAMLYVCYGCFAKIKFGNMIRQSSNRLIVIIGIVPGYVIYRYWRHKYLDKGTKE